jgi:hypothetical protein
MDVNKHIFLVMDVAEGVRQLTASFENLKLDLLKNVTFQLSEFEKKSGSVWRPKVSGSNTDHGKAIYNSLNSSWKISVAPEGEGPAIVSEELFNAAKDQFNKTRRPHEKVLVSLYTPSLIQVVDQVNPDLRLVNSEFFKWLQSMSGYSRADMMPDLFSAHHALVEFSPPYKDAPECAATRVFGRFISWESRASIHCIWDAKWQIDMSAFGEKCKYLQITGESAVDHNGAPLALKGVLFDLEEFWMINSRGNVIVDVVKCKWCQGGSRQILRDFLCAVDPWMEAVNALCNALNVEISDFSNSGRKESAFLGCGANGRVFKLVNGQVLKVVVGNRSKEVEKEYLLMQNCLARREIRSLVFPVVEGTYRCGIVSGGVDYAGYLLARKGEKIALPVSDETKVKLADLLYGLHCNDVTHGDPRIDNALMLDGTMMWIDFRQTEFVTCQISRRREVEILLQSLLPSDNKISETDTSAEIKAYVDKPSVERLCAVLLKK